MPSPIALQMLQSPTSATATARRIITLEEISDRKRAEISLRKREEHFRTIAENVADLIAVVDRSGYRVYNSPSYGKILGYAPEEIKGTWSFGRIHPDDRDMVINAAKEAFESGEGNLWNIALSIKMVPGAPSPQPAP
jgi:PAS domain-containing protein